jgi:hypothetical protein
MDLALRYNFDAHQLYCINLCRLYLQVITVSDRATGKGDMLLQSAQKGRHNDQCVSTLEWPMIPMPTSSNWTHWRLFLQHLGRGRKLHQPLGQWLASPHYQWRWFVDASHTVWEEQPDTQTWLQYHRIRSQRRLTRRSTSVYREGNLSQDLPPMDQSHPVTVLHRPDGTFFYAANAFRLVPSHSTTPPDLWHNVDVPPALVNTPPFYQHLLNYPPTEDQCLAIAKEAAE